MTDCTAVLDAIGVLHKPRQTKVANAFGVEFDGLECTTCLSPGGKAAPWPCPTMKEVDKVLPLAEWTDHYRTGCNHGMAAHGPSGCRDCRCTTPGRGMPLREATT